MFSYNEFECVFRHCDVDGDGKVSPKELQHCVKNVCGEISQQEVEEIVSSLDSDGDGLLGFEDFVGLVKGKLDDDDEGNIKDLKEAFSMYVMEGFEAITPLSLKRMLNRLGESRTIEECRVMIDHFDINGDGMLSLDEFMVMMQ
ncbi:Calcium-binding protein [Thalictrum thalictroides]|uniref:Calcium-binding protein n=1 Tax=Thalictrum thalictroides TaxID=46969 RepID=A0A7J6XAA9_THATH|nr:Calcium-binding protein [Thalictrum thalictroides]